MAAPDGLMEDFDSSVAKRVAEYRRLDGRNRVDLTPPLGSDLRREFDRNLRTGVMTGACILGLGICSFIAAIILAAVVDESFLLVWLPSIIVGAFGCAIIGDARDRVATVKAPKSIAEAVGVAEVAGERFSRVDAPMELMAKVRVAVERINKQFGIWTDEVEAKRAADSLAREAHEEILLLAAQLEVTLEAQTLRHRVTGRSAPMELSLRDEAQLALDEVKWYSDGRELS